MLILPCSRLCFLQVNANELTNGVINAAFMLLFKDAIRLFAAYNEGIINLLGKDKLLSLAYAYFTPQRPLKSDLKLRK